MTYSRNQNIIRRNKDTEIEISRFKESWTRLHTMYSFCGKVENKPEEMINNFRNYIPTIIKHCEKNNCDWEWCIDLDSFGGRLYNPLWVTTSDGRYWSLCRKHELTPGLMGKKGKQRWKVNNDFMVKYYGNDCGGVTISLGQLIANYFLAKPEQLFGNRNADITVGHIYQYDPDKPWWDNDNVSNLAWQSFSMNFSTTELLRKGKWEDALTKDFLVDSKHEKNYHPDFQSVELTVEIEDILKPFLNQARVTTKEKTAAEIAYTPDGNKVVTVGIDLNR